MIYAISKTEVGFAYEGIFSVKCVAVSTCRNDKMEKVKIRSEAPVNRT
jgi:ribosomal protein L23